MLLVFPGFQYCGVVIRFVGKLWLTFSSLMLCRLLTHEDFFICVALLTFDGTPLKFICLPTHLHKLNCVMLNTLMFECIRQMHT